MLLHKGTLQPPRKYPFPPSDPDPDPNNPLHPSPPLLINSTDTCPPPTYPLCPTCHTQIWTPSLFSSLHALALEQTRYEKSYQIEAKTLREAVMRGCAWCKKLADGINGEVFLEAVYEEWGATDSWAGSGSEEEGDGVEYLEGGDEDDEDDSKEGRESEDQDLEHEDAWQSAGAFNRDNIKNDTTGGWNSYSDGDILAIDATLSISLSFERSETGQFIFLNVRIEAIDEEEDNVLRRVRGEKAVMMRWRINRTAATAVTSDIAEEDTDLFPPQPLNTTLGSESNLKYACEWARKTIQLIEPSNLNALQIPSRLIDIKLETLRVVETSGLQPPQETDGDILHGYAALSYVWGQKQTFVLLHSTKKALMSSFAISQLPKTIQDAVMVTRAMGLRYLWVDALCMYYAGFPEDKAVELPKMRVIYQKAAITLIASVAESATEGFLHHVPEVSYLIPPIHIPIPSISGSPSSTPKEARNQDEAMALSYPSPYARHLDPINMRAWTFQELLLSPRCLLFTYRGLETIDRLHIPSPSGLLSGRDPQLPNLPWSGPMFRLTDVKKEDIRAVWLTVRGEYSRRKLSYEGDKLIAIAAVAEEVGKVYGGRYLAGLWERDLHSELKWCHGDARFLDGGQEPGTAPHRSRYQGYVAPSWSWASVGEPVDDYAFDEHGDEENEASQTLGFRILSVQVQPVIPEYEFGAVKSGVLVLEGRIHAFVWRPEDAPTPMSSDGFLAVQAENKPHVEYKVGEAIVDAEDPELVDGCVVVCVAMDVEERIPGQKEVEGLMLLEVNEEVYRRVGFCRIRVTELFEDAELVEITII